MANPVNLSVIVDSRSSQYPMADGVTIPRPLEQSPPPLHARTNRQWMRTRLQLQSDHDQTAMKIPSGISHESDEDSPERIFKFDDELEPVIASALSRQTDQKQKTTSFPDSVWKRETTDSRHPNSHDADHKPQSEQLAYPKRRLPEIISRDHSSTTSRTHCLTSAACDESIPTLGIPQRHLTDRFGHALIVDDVSWSPPKNQKEHLMATQKDVVSDAVHPDASRGDSDSSGSKSDDDELMFKFDGL